MDHFRAFQDLNRLTLHSEEQEWRLQPCLSEAEARVVSVVMKEAEQAGERASEAISRIPELSFPQQVCSLVATGQEVSAQWIEEKDRDSVSDDDSVQF